MTVKRFEFREVNYSAIVPRVYDTEKQQYANLFECVHWLNELNDKCEFLEIENEPLEDDATRYAELYHQSLKENEQLKKHIKFLEKQYVLLHYISLQCGQYDKVLDKKEITMLLDEYETILKELKE